MKTITLSAVVLIVITTVLLAQNQDPEKQPTTDVVQYIKQETIGGELDFRGVLENPGEVIAHSNGVRFNKKDYHVFLWGESVRRLGFTSSDKAARLWEEIHAEKLTGPQRTALRIGVERKFEQ